MNAVIIGIFALFVAIYMQFERERMCTRVIGLSVFSCVPFILCVYHFVVVFFLDNVLCM